MITVMFIALTATGVAIWAISQRTKIGARLWEFQMTNLDGETLKFHVRSNDYSAALKSAFEARKMHNDEGNTFNFKVIYELHPETQQPIHQVWQSSNIVEPANVDA